MPEILARANFYLFEGEGANPQMRSGGGPSGAPADKGRATALHIQYDILILMNTMERITITLTPEMAQAVRGAVEAGEYASSSEIVPMGDERLKDRDASAGPKAPKRISSKSGASSPGTIVGPHRRRSARSRSVSPRSRVIPRSVPAGTT